MKRIVQLACAGLLASTLAATAAASPIYGTAVDPNDANPNNDYTGTRVYHDEGAAGQAMISWEITQSGPLFTYRYTFMIPGGGPTFKDVSHFTLDLSDDFADEDELDLRTSFSTNSKSYDPNDPDLIEFGDKDDLTGAVKFDFGGGKDGNTTDGEKLYFEFTVDRSPVWGNLGVKAGTPLHHNAGLGNEGSSMDPNDFVAVPNGELNEGPPIPEPASLAIALLVTAMFTLTRRGRFHYRRT